MGNKRLQLLILLLALLTATHGAAATMTSTTVFASNTAIDAAQTQNILVTETGGTANFNYNIMVYNTIGLVISSNSAFSASATNTFTFTQATAWGTGTFTVNTITTDGTPNTLSNTITYAVAAAMAPTISVSNASLGRGQTQNVLIAVVGGTPNYDYNILVYNSIGLVASSNSASFTSSATNTFTFTQATAWGTGVFTVNLILTDQATSANTAKNTITYTTNAALSPTILMANVGGYDVGQTISIGARAGGGTPPYTYNYIIANSVTGSILYSQLASNALRGNLITYTIPSAWVGNTIRANVIITDSEVPANVANSINSNAIAINGGFSTTSLVSSNSVADQGQYDTFTHTASGGTSPFTYNTAASNAINGNIVANSLSYATAATSNALSTMLGSSANTLGTLDINAIAQDSSGLPQYDTAFQNPLSGNYPACPCNYISASGSGANFPLGSSARSVFAWVYVNSQLATDSQAACQLNFGNCWYSVFGSGSGGCDNYFELITFGYNNAPGLDVATDLACYQEQSSLVISPNSWHFIGATYAAGSNTMTLYLDGTMQAGVPIVDPPSNVPNTLHGIIAIGDNGASVSGGFPGSIADVQFYNSSLSQAAVTSLYDEGMGGVPVMPQNIIGWWPLNGDTNDYSGNNNNGVPHGTFYQSNLLSMGHVPMAANITASNTITVNPAFAAPSAPSINQTGISAGQSITISAPASGGTSPYTYNFLIATTATNAIEIYSGPTALSSFMWRPYIQGSFYSNVIVYDSASTPVVSNSIYSAVFTVGPAPPQSHGGGSSTSTTSVATTSLLTSSTTTPSTTATTTIETVNVTNKAGRNITLTLNASSAEPVYVSISRVQSSFTVHIGYPSLTKINMTVKNITGSVKFTPPGYGRLLVMQVNVSVQHNATSNAIINSSVEITTKYNCSLQSSSITPFLLVKGSWSKISPFTVNATGCTVTFSIPADPVVGIFAAAANQSPPTTTSVTASTSTMPQKTQGTNPVAYAWAAAAIIAVAIAGYLVLRRLAGKPGRA